MDSFRVRGYTGKIARIDLSSKRAFYEDIDQYFAETWIGGTGFGAKILYDEVPAHVGWSDCENRLVIASGPLEATGLSGAGSFSAVGKGPMTNFAGASQANGFFGAYLKLSGFDGIILQGASANLVYLIIKKGMVYFRRAEQMAGKDMWKTEDIIRKELGVKGKEVSIIGIGPAGEKLVRYATIVGDKGHVCSKNGLGAIMGSKGVKAIVAFKDERSFEIEDIETLKRFDNKLFEHSKGWFGGLIYDWGTGGSFSGAYLGGFLPIKNFTAYSFPEHAKLDTHFTRTHFEVTPKPCYLCRHAHCKEVTIKEGPFSTLKAEEPEFELLSAWGPMIGQSDYGAVVMLSDLTDRLGIDCNEASWTIGWLMECYEKGALTKKDTDGLEMKWGNVESVKQILLKIANREGIGNILAEGVMRASEKIGGQARDWAIYSKTGTTPRGHDHRGRWTELFDTCVSNTSTIESSWVGVYPELLGLPPLSDQFSHKEVSTILAKTNGWRQFDDCLVTCRICHTEPNLVLSCLNAITGWKLNIKDAMLIGQRIVNTLRMFNFRHGHSILNERPSARYGSVPSDGPAKGKNIMKAWDSMIKNYYMLMGWHPETGKPLPDTLSKLGLEWMIEDE